MQFQIQIFKQNIQVWVFFQIVKKNNDQAFLIIFKKKKKNRKIKIKNSTYNLNIDDELLRSI